MSAIVKFGRVHHQDKRAKSFAFDTDVAGIYGVETKRVNEAMKNNPDKFSDGYIMELDKNEWDSLKSNF